MLWSKKNKNLFELKLGDRFAYDNEHWIVSEIGVYDWEKDGKSKEYLVKNNEGISAYLEVEKYKGALDVKFSEPIQVPSANIKAAIEDEELYIDDTRYELDEMSAGKYLNETHRDSWEEVKNYVYYCNETHFVCIESIRNIDFVVLIGCEINENELKF